MVVSVTDILADPEGGFWAWTALSGAAIAAAGAILAFLYAWGTLFRNNEMTSYVKLEIYELIVSALIVLIVLGIAGSLDTLQIGGLMPAALIPPGVSHAATIYELTEVYFLQVESDFSSWLNMNYVLNMYVDMAASITPYARPLGIGLISSPLAGLASPLKQLLYNATTALTIAYVVNMAQYYVFVFAVDAFLFYYLPVGIFLRCFTPTRRMGGTIIGICLGFLLIFPFLTTLSYFVFYNPTGPMETFRSFTTYYFRDYMFEGGTFGDMMSTYLDPNKYEGFATFLTGVLGGFGDMLQNVFGGIFLAVMMFPISVIGRAFVIGYVIPAFNVMLFTQATISLSKSLGEEVDIGALTRMI